MKFRQFVTEEAGRRRRWDIAWAGRTVEVRWDAADGRAARLVKELPSEGSAQGEMERLVRSRLAAGYQELPGEQE